MRRGKTAPRLRAIVFTRSPVLGAVKTRLAAEIGEREALEIHVELLRRTIDAVLGAAAKNRAIVPEIHHLGPPDAFARHAASGVRLEAQRAAGMVENLEAILGAFAIDGADGVIVVGSDHPDISASHILAMADLLELFPVCVGPAEDGGFWSIGTRVPLVGVMGGGFLETAGAMAGLRAALSRAGLVWGEGPVLYDLDTGVDLARFRESGRAANS